MSTRLQATLDARPAHYSSRKPVLRYPTRAYQTDPVSINSDTHVTGQNPEWKRAAPHNEVLPFHAHLTFKASYQSLPDSPSRNRSTSMTSMAAVRASVKRCLTRINSVVRRCRSGSPATSLR